MLMFKTRIEHERRPAGRECAFILAINSTAKPEPKLRPSKQAPRGEEFREEKAVSSDGDYGNKPMAKKKSKPRATATPAKAKKAPRPALVGLDVNAPGLFQVCDAWIPDGEG